MIWRPQTTRSKVMVAIASILATVLVTLLVVNFSSGEKQIKQEISRLYAVSDPQFQRSMGVMLGPQIVDGNKVEALLNGDQIFPSMLKAIRGAKKTINFETYIYWSEEIGREFAEALSERARAGVKVHLLIDWVGSAKMDDKDLEQMRQAGVEVRQYHPLRWYNLGRINNRTHRKLLVVDGRIGFTGGVGIAGQWTGNAQDPDHWRDSHFRAEGPVVAQMQAVLIDNWTKTTGKVLHGDDYFPPQAQPGTARAQVFSSSPSGGSESMHLMYLLAITAAERNIQISASYFVPDEMTRNALIDAMKRGVRLQIILPGKNIDAEAVRSSSRGMWGELLQAGAEISEYQPTMYHCKVMIVDGLLVSVGSTNFDDRSFQMNDEANLNIYDAGFARQQIAIFEQDLKKARRITYEQWLDRPLKEKAWEKVASWLGPLL
ncbi:phospholipase D-like domain-containing protein [Noviherbaspirillum sp. L7-7A]|uniref:phospholipase D-like domain-containing protein n=1 Tax=Noviherbaspirillum sp. L7-7A TaxID=2850560 RepID=UPI002011EE20|nr:phospholipase D-like domain-containing protein [Noviherbaspirillum sp. L7-7A]